MEKTTNYQLNKPEAADPLRVADFNENADKIDAALNSLNTVVAGLVDTENVVVGFFTGNGVGTRTVSLGVTPKFILLLTLLNTNIAVVSFVGTGFGYHMNSSAELKASTTRVVSGGIRLENSSHNVTGYTTHYVAFL